MAKDEKGIIRAVHDLFIGNGLTISAAESCTGGLISHYLTTMPGSGNFFIAGVVTYSAESKKIILDVLDNTIAQYGVISAETAKEMAERIRLMTKTDYSVSSTGNLGPDVLEGKEKGLVYIAVSCEQGTSVRDFRFHGSRDENKKDAAIAALMMLIEILRQRSLLNAKEDD
ncbi:MAG: CinA family protein [Nitrospirae bacterium]|nr:CinA family protein [Nitrospirota bacterium]